jgi:hypothetical protein
MLASPPEAVTQTPVNLIRHESAPVFSRFFSAGCEGLYLCSATPSLCPLPTMTDYTGEHPKGPDPTENAPQIRNAVSTASSSESSPRM